MDLDSLALQIKTWGQKLGFPRVGITDLDLSTSEPAFLAWLQSGYHAQMDYMARYGVLRARPLQWWPEAIRVVSLAMPYWPGQAQDAFAVLNNPALGYISRYALGRDYHALIRQRLKQLSRLIESVVPGSVVRGCVDTAPLLEKPLAVKAGLGWQGKNANLIAYRQGSWFFLGEIFTKLPLPIDPPTTKNHCGSCQRCLEACPTKALVSPGVLDSRRCISYMTIEHPGDIPESLHSLIGNRIYGCDDCQLVCPWNRQAFAATESDFTPRHGLDAPELLTLRAWSEQAFLQRTEGSPLRRIGYIRWQRNLAIALKNASLDILPGLKAGDSYGAQAQH